MSKTMKNYDSHVYLYAKGWYKKSDIISDLKVIYGLRNCIDPEYISISNILECILTLTSKHMINHEYSLGYFISSISPHAFKRTFYKDQVYDFNKAVIEECLSIISLTLISDIPEDLDEPDPSVLPLKDKE